MAFLRAGHGQGAGAGRCCCSLEKLGAAEQTSASLLALFSLWMLRSPEEMRALHDFIFAQNHGFVGKTPRCPDLSLRGQPPAAGAVSHQSPVAATVAEGPELHPKIVGVLTRWRLVTSV